MKPPNQYLTVVLSEQAFPRDVLTQTHHYQEGVTPRALTTWSGKEKASQQDHSRSIAATSYKWQGDT